MRISVVICTKDRPKKLGRSISSIRPQLGRQDELIVVDGSPTRSAMAVARGLSYLHVRGGLSSARNEAISQAKGDVIVFTDDDCIAEPHWLSAVRSAFSTNLRAGIVFGQVLPFAPERHRGLVSMSLSPGRKRNVFREPPRAIFGIGTGNNMSIRRDVFRKIGVFLPWLGAGSVCPGAEEEEFAYRALREKIAVLREPDAIIYHDRWMTKRDRKDIITAYSAGYFAFLTWHALVGDLRTRKVLMVSLKALLRDPDSFQQLFFCAKGLLVATWQRMRGSLRQIFVNY